MLPYKRADARAWARENLIGCSAVTIPSYSADLKPVSYTHLTLPTIYSV